MNSKKKTKLMIIAVAVLAVSALVIAGAAIFASESESKIMLHVDFPTADVKAGGTLDVTVSVTNKDVSLFNMAGLQIELAYDPTYVTPGEVTPLLSSTESLFRSGIKNNKVIFICVKNEFTDTEGYSKIGDLFKVTFTAKKAFTPSALFTKNSVDYLVGDVEATKISLAELTVGDLENSEWYLSQPDGLVFSDVGVLFRYKGEAGEFAEVPSGTAEISSGAFKGQSKLKYVYVPESVETIEDGAFDSGVTVVCENGSVAQGYAAAKGLKNPTVKGVEVTTLPDKTLYIPNEEFDRTGMVVTLSFNDGGSAETDGYTVSEIQYVETGKQPLTVTSIGRTAQFEISVSMTAIPGDANGDGFVSAADIVRIKKHIAAKDGSGKSTVAVAPGADADGSGTVDALDIVRLKRYFAELDPLTGLSSVTLGE